MNKRNYTIIALIIGLLMANAIIHAQETIAVVVQVKGEATVYRIDGEGGETVNRGTRLQTGDRLITGSNTHVALRFIDDASLVRISSISTCVIEGTRENNQILKNVYLEAGTILSKITDQKGQYKVITPTSVASVKGTEFITVQSDNPGTYYYGNEGEVEISNEAGTVLLRVGFTVYVASDNTPPVIHTDIVSGDQLIHRLKITVVIDLGNDPSHLVHRIRNLGKSVS